MAQALGVCLLLSNGRWVTCNKRKIGQETEMEGESTEERKEMLRKRRMILRKIEILGCLR